MADLKVTQVRSTNGAKPHQRETLRSLGLGKIGRSSVHSDGPQVRGMLRAVEHMVQVEEGSK
jgi:large subunit ribosomal protein L30